MKSEKKPSKNNKNTNNTNFFRTTFFLILVVLGVMWVINIFTVGMQAIVEKLSYTQFYSYLQNNLTRPTIASVTITDNLIRGVYTKEKDAGRFYLYIPPEDQEVLSLLKTNVEKVDVEPARTLLSNLFYSLGPMVLFILFLWYFSSKGNQMGSKLWSFGQSRAKIIEKEKSTQVTFQDVAGVEEAKDELKEIIEFLRNPKRFQRLGGRIPKGVLLVGPPGCGKTILAKAVAGEAGVPFFSISGSDFVEMFVGVGASVSKYTPVAIKTQEGVQLLSISEFVDKFYPEGKEGYVVPVKGVKTLGYLSKRNKTSKSNNRLFGASAWQDVKGVFRHKVEEIYEIDYLGGKIEVTGDHSVFVRDKNRIIAKRADQLMPGDILVNLPFKVRGEFVPSFGTKHFVRGHNFLEYNFKDLTVWEEDLEMKQNYEFAMQNRGVISQSKIAEYVGVSQSTVGLWQRSLCYPRALSEEAVPSLKKLPQKVSVTEGLLRLFGYYTAEGRRTDYAVEFVFGIHEEDLHKDCISLVERIFNLKANLTETEDNTLRIRYHSKILGDFFQRHCGNGSHNKHIPQFLWDVPKEYFLSYLEGATKGDGYISKEGKLILCSVSKQLILELCWLSALHGIKTGLRKCKSKEGRIIKNKPLPGGDYYLLIIGKTSNPFFEGKKDYQFKKPIINRIVKKPYQGYVYDLCGCENEAFFGGEKPLLLHNSRVRDLFEQAKKASKIGGKGGIIFIDEIDAVGRQRFSGIGGGHDEREQTLNQLLVEMDGFQTEVGIVVMAATNRPDVLDPALLRPGRFDRHVVIDGPDIKGREAILKVHTRKVKLAPGINLRVIAKQTVGFSGADLENLCNEAALLAARRKKESVEMDELQESIERVVAGPQRKSRIISNKEKEIIAYHEAGHSLLSLYLEHVDPLHKVSIIPRGIGALGYTLQLPTQDRYILSKIELEHKLCVLLGGRAAEAVALDQITTGAQNDLEVATSMARKMVTHLGMSEKIGNVSLGRSDHPLFLGKEFAEQKDYSEETARLIDNEVKRFVEEALDLAKKILKEHKEELEKVTKQLLEKEVLEADEVRALIGLAKVEQVDEEPEA